jgi:hypothetical protein
MNNVEKAKEQELAFTEKIEPLMKLVMYYCEKEGLSLVAKFKGECGFRGSFNVGDNLLDISDIYTQLQLYEARHDKKLI